MPKRLEHKILDGKELKYCSKCSQWLPIEQFFKNRATWDGVTNICKDCMKKRNSAYNKEYNKKYLQREDVKAQRRINTEKWHKNNPEHVRLLKRNARAKRQTNLKGTIAQDEWSQLCARYEYRCAYCGQRRTLAELTMDHMIPLSRGGLHHISNIVPACMHCNCEKGSKTYEEYVASLYGGE
jgi:5-methylcytosine-specific restriction endonuclease McrA